jgi:hypothetical protein
MMMIWKGLLFLTAVGLMATAQANSRPSQHLEVKPVATCSAYMTEAECSAHQRILTFLTDPRERAAYLAMHAQLIEERRAACGVPSDRRARDLVSLTSSLR